MKLKQIVCDGTDLTLTKERKKIKFGNEFEVSEERGKEILAATFKGKPVAEIVPEKPVDEGNSKETEKVEKTTSKTKTKK